MEVNILTFIATALFILVFTIFLLIIYVKTSGWTVNKLSRDRYDVADLENLSLYYPKDLAGRSLNTFKVKTIPFENQPSKKVKAEFNKSELSPAVPYR
ncbi:hypothetical protein HN51_069560 [Arachis hypogaea]